MVEEGDIWNGGVSGWDVESAGRRSVVVSLREVSAVVSVLVGVCT